MRLWNYVFFFHFFPNFPISDNTQFIFLFFSYYVFSTKKCAHIIFGIHFLTHEHSKRKADNKKNREMRKTENFSFTSDQTSKQRRPTVKKIISINILAYLTWQKIYWHSHIHSCMYTIHSFHSIDHIKKKTCIFMFSTAAAADTAATINFYISVVFLVVEGWIYFKAKLI